MPNKPIARPQLWFWKPRALYVGPVFGLSAHRNTVTVLCVGLDTRLGVAVDPRDPQKGYEHCRCAFIPGNTLHHLQIRRGRMAFLYVDPLSLDVPRLGALARRVSRRAAFDFVHERALTATLRSLSDGKMTWAAARERLGSLLDLVTGNEADPRITPDTTAVARGSGRSASSVGAGATGRAVAIAFYPPLQGPDARAVPALSPVEPPRLSAINLFDWHPQRF